MSASINLAIVMKMKANENEWRSGSMWQRNRTTAASVSAYQWRNNGSVMFSHYCH
jgi:hypothetical protein